ncbi:hypothetical protein N9H39_08985 [Gammaproteobacteria bacterium]|nr:hypothetical protein [Gammaproteobacteria bacterium]
MILTESYTRLVIDLSEFRCGHSQLGYPPSGADFFTRSLTKNEIFEDATHGLEVGIRSGVLNYIFLAIGNFPGGFKYRGKDLELSTNTTIDDVRTIFGDPYWLDDDTDETLLFYEDGKVEVQYEFPGKQKLNYITILLDQIMADPEQRKGYGVTKPWPP